MTGIEYVDRHEAKIKSITMEAPEGYEFGNVVRAEIEMRVGKLEYQTDKEGNLVRTAVLVVEGCHIKESLDPAQAYASTPSPASSVDDDDDDEGDGADEGATPPDLDPETGEIPLREGDEEKEPVPAGVGAGNDLDVGF